MYGATVLLRRDMAVTCGALPFAAVPPLKPQLLADIAQYL
jgi:hypothetical protein